MSTLYMIRHGQASFGASNYDKLSDLGITQSFFLGEHWVLRDQRIDVAISGIQERQRHTLELVAEVYKTAGKDFPELEIDENFNEYDATGIMMKFFPRLLKQNDKLKEIVASQSQVQNDPLKARKSFQEAFDIVMNRWIEGDTGVDDVESWADFNARVVHGIERLMEKYPDGKNIAVFSSGGPISAAMRYALDLTYKKALDLSWVIKNSSVTEFRFKADRFTLVGFNSTPHFHEDALVSYR